MNYPRQAVSQGGTEQQSEQGILGRILPCDPSCLVVRTPRLRVPVDGLAGIAATLLVGVACPSGDVAGHAVQLLPGFVPGPIRIARRAPVVVIVVDRAALRDLNRDGIAR